MDLNLSVSGGESIKVFVRVRPPDPALETDLESTCLGVTSETSLSVYSKPEPKTFTFDHVAGMDITQEDVFSAVGRPIIESCMGGYNGTIFAYGQTGSGKTFTMIGPPDDSESDTFTHELRGIIPRSFEYLFSLINREIQKYGDLVEFLCRCSFLEIYNEQVYDLLDTASPGLHLRENIKHGVYVDGLTEQSVSSARDAYRVLSTGWVNRRVASTSMNRESSRSHAVFTLTIESKKREAKDSVAKIKTSLLNLVDLAGSERQRDTHTVGVRLKEAGSINKSLSALGNVIMALVDIAHGKSRHVHYRDSKLTFLLRDSLGGNAKTNLVANIHPSARCFGETLSTLNFAKRAKMIKNQAVVNEDTSGNVLQLQSEIKRLKEALEKYRMGLISPSSSSPSLLSRGNDVSLLASPCASYVSRSDDEKTIRELREMLSTSMFSRDKTERENMGLQEKVENLEKLCDKKDKFLQSTKMILRFRETHINNLEKSRRSGSGDEREMVIKLLQQEIEQLKYKIDHHPDVTKFAMENLELRGEIKKLRSTTTGSQDLPKELARSHQYTLQLERQLRYYLTRGNSSQSDVLSPVKQLLSTTPSKQHSLDIEKLQGRFKQLQEELEKTRHTLSTEREEFHLRESKLDASLATTRKANQELERTIEALKLKSSVERATLNDMHMNTIRSMLSPKRGEAIRPTRSATNTPFYRADSDPLRARLSFNGPLTSPHLSTTISDSPEIRRRDMGLPRSPICRSMGVNTDISGDLPVSNGIDDLNIEGALTDELKILQDSSRGIQQQLEESEVLVSRMAHEKATLEAQLGEVTQLSRTEHEAARVREQELLEKMAEMASKVADLTSSNTVLQSEVTDLRVCIKSADHEIAELEAEWKRENKVHETRLMEHMQRIGELEQLLSTSVLELERRTEELQNLQDEAETLREELTFKDHQVSKLEQAVLREKERGSSLEGEIQVLLDKLTVEVEKTMRLSSELQEGHNGKQELVTALNENSRLAAEVQQLENDFQNQLQSHKKQMEEAEVTMNTLLKRQAEDKDAISGFMVQVQELRAEDTTKAARITSLQQDLEESSRELCSSTTKNDQLDAELRSLQARLNEQLILHERELTKKEEEYEVVCDENDSLNEQYQQLHTDLQALERKLSNTQSEAKRLTEENAVKDAEVKRLLLKRDRKDSMTRSQSISEGRDMAAILEARAEEIDRLKTDLDHATALIDKYEQTQDEKNQELHHLKDELQSFEQLQQDYHLLETTYSSLQYKSDKSQEREATARAQLEQLQLEFLDAVRMKDRSLEENKHLHTKCQSQRSTIESLNDQLERYKTLEEKLFTEKETLKSQYETAMEERAKLSKECTNLTKENAEITGHHNLRQRIHYHAATKMENSKLKEEVMQLNSRLKAKSYEVNQLQMLLSHEKDFSSKQFFTKKPPTAIPHKRSTDSLKENVEPH